MPTSSYIDLIGAFLISAPFMFFLCVTVTLLSFLVSEKLIDNMMFNPVPTGLLFGLVNGCITVFMDQLSLRIDLEQPALSVILPTLVLILEICIVSKDKPFAYLYLAVTILLNFSCFYYLATSLVMLYPSHLYARDSLDYHNILFSICLILIVIALLFAHMAPNFPRDEIKALMHSPDRGILLLSYMSISDFVLVLSMHLNLPTIRILQLAREAELAIYMDQLLFVSLILNCTYLILLLQSFHERRVQQLETLDAKLQDEQGFRISGQRHPSSLMSYVSNITQNRIIEGQEYLSPQLMAEAGSYTNLVKVFTQQCVHPDDWPRLSTIQQPNYYENRLENEPSYYLLFRLSPKAFMKLVSLPPWAQETLTQSDKEWIWVRFHCVITQSVSNNDILAYVTMANVDDQVVRDKLIRKMASTDPLTNLLNRAAFEHQVREYLKDENAAGAFILIDLDHFKQVNDQLGHPMGDQVLKETATMIQSVFRDGDLVGRIGGDEFCVFTMGLRLESIIEQRATELREKGRRVYQGEEGAPIHTSLSVGIVLCPNYGTDYDTLYRCADTAMYHVKQAGRDGFRFYTADMSPDPHH